MIEPSSEIEIRYQQILSYIYTKLSSYTAIRDKNLPELDKISIISNPFHLFVSHTTKDRVFIDKNITNPLMKSFKSDFKIFCLDFSDSPFALGYARYVVPALIAHKHIFIVISESSLGSVWVKEEINWIIKRGDKRILIINLENCAYLDSFPELSPFQMLNLTSDIDLFHENLKKVIFQWKAEDEKLKQEFISFGQNWLGNFPVIIKESKNKMIIDLWECTAPHTLSDLDFLKEKFHDTIRKNPESSFDDLCYELDLPAEIFIQKLSEWKNEINFTLRDYKVIHQPKLEKEIESLKKTSIRKDFNETEYLEASKCNFSVSDIVIESQSKGWTTRSLHIFRDKSLVSNFDFGLSLRNNSDYNIYNIEITITSIPRGVKLENRRFNMPKFKPNSKFSLGFNLVAQESNVNGSIEFSSKIIGPTGQEHIIHISPIVIPHTTNLKYPRLIPENKEVYKKIISKFPNLSME